MYSDNTEYSKTIKDKSQKAIKTTEVVFIRRFQAYFEPHRYPFDKLLYLNFKAKERERDKERHYVASFVML